MCSLPVFQLGDKPKSVTSKIKDKEIEGSFKINKLEHGKLVFLASIHQGFQGEFWGTEDPN